MFEALAKLLSTATQVDLLVTGNGDEMTVTVIPKIKDGVAALKTPLNLTGTPAELDEGFAQALLSYTSARKSLADQVAQTTSILDAAKKQEAAKAVKKAPAAAKPAAMNIDELSEEEGEGDNGAAGGASSEQGGTVGDPEPKAKAEANGAIDLADLL